MGVARGILDARGIDYDEPREVGKAFGIARAMAAEIEWHNDEWFRWRLPEPGSVRCDRCQSLLRAMGRIAEQIEAAP